MFVVVSSLNERIALEEKRDARVFRFVNAMRRGRYRETVTADSKILRTVDLSYTVLESTTPC